MRHSTETADRSTPEDTVALTITPNDSFADDVFGRHRARFVTITFDSSYAVGGEALTPAQLGFASIDIVLTSPDASVSAGYVVQYDYVAQKLMVLGVQQDADAATTEPLDQEDTTVDLSAVVVRLCVIGH